MEPRFETLTMYGVPSEMSPLAWSWVEAQLVGAGTYWVIARGEGQPHPRPVWGVWVDGLLHLSLGSPGIVASLERDGAVTVHLDSALDVVILEGRAAGATASAALLDAYHVKYDWDYDVDRYGPLRTIAPTTVLAWRSAGWAGRDGFQETGRWRFDSTAAT